MSLHRFAIGVLLFLIPVIAYPSIIHVPGDPDTTGLNLPLLDLSGSERIYKGVVDMGAYEYNLPTTIPENSDQGDFHLYPNPSTGQMFLECREPKRQDELLLRICNIKGVIVVSKGHPLYQQKIIKE
jgi:hypothetical protein